MSEPTTPNKGYTIPNTGDLNNAWGPPINANFTDIDTALSGSQSIALTSGGTVTMTSAQAQYIATTLTGTLTGNGTIFALPAVGGFYLLNNETSGSYAITCQVTGAPGSTVTLPSGWAIVYTDGTNVSLAAQAVAFPLAIAQGGTAATSAASARSNLGAAASGANSDITSLSGLTTALSIAQGGTGTNSATGSGSVVLANSPTLSNPTLSGTPVAPTASSGTSSTQIATTAFSNPANLLSTNGYQKFPSGLILQWGTGTTPSGGVANVTFTTPFSVECWAIVAIPIQDTVNIFCSANEVTTSSFNLYVNTPSGGGASSPCFWIAIGQ